MWGDVWIGRKKVQLYRKIFFLYFILFIYKKNKWAVEFVAENKKI